MVNIYNLYQLYAYLFLFVPGSYCTLESLMKDLTHCIMSEL